MDNFYYSDEIYHHGIKGQKWGVRRYQNADGSLTSAGKQREAVRGTKAGRKYAHEAIKRYSKGKPVSKRTAKILSKADTSSPEYRKAFKDAAKTAGQEHVKDVKRSSETDTSTIARLYGSSAGAAIGGTIGSIIPGAGTIAGGAVGAVVGSIAAANFGRRKYRDWRANPKTQAKLNGKERRTKDAANRVMRDIG